MITFAKRLANATRKYGQSVGGRRSAQSTVELALLLPTLVFMLAMIIYAYKVNHKLSEQTHATYAEKMYKYHTEGLSFGQRDLPSQGAIW